MVAYRADIDGLRAVAIVAVVAFHAFPDLLPGGFVGVDVFFVISGYLITSIILKSGLREFYARRVVRLFPALIAVLSACLAAGWFVLLPSEYAQIARHTIAGALFVENFLLWTEVGYWDTDAALKPLLHLWSLAVEEQFYLVFPLVLLAAGKLRWNLVAVVSASGALSLAFCLWAPEFYLPHTRWWELMAGALLTLIAPTPLFKNAFSALGLALIALSCFIPTRESFPGWQTLLPVIGTVVVIAAGPSAHLNRALSSRGIVFVGLISYALYLWHWPLLSFARILSAGEPPDAVKLAALGVAVLLAAGTYLFIERPIRRAAMPGRKAVLLACGMAAVIAVAAVPQRVEDTGYPPFDNALCRHAYPGFAGIYCTLHRPGDPTVLLVGDSHAMALNAGLAAALEQKGQNLLNLASSGCLPYYDVELDAAGGPLEGDEVLCRTHINEALDIAIDTPSIGAVVLASYGGLALGAPSDDAIRKLSNAMIATVNRLTAAGKTVVLVVDVPELPFSPKSCEDRPLVPATTDCSMPRTTFEQMRSGYNDLMRFVATQTDAIVFQAANSLCDDVSCWGMKNNRVLYDDFNHLNVDGSLLVGGDLARLIEDRASEP